MKKIILVFFCILLLCGCSNHRQVDQSDSTVVKEYGSQMKHENRSYKYDNTTGNLINLEKDVVKDNEKRTYKYGNTPGNLINLGKDVVKDNYIYSESFDFERNDYSLYRFDLDGSNKVKIADINPSYINIIEDYIYLLNSNSNEYSIYKMKLDGSMQSRLGNVSNVNFVSVVNNEIFYSVDRQNNEYDPGIYKMSLDGTDNVKLISGNCAYITVSEGWIYFTIREEGGFMLYKMRADGKELTKLCEDNVEYSNLYKGWIYYSKDDGIYKIRIDGTDKLKISSKVGWNINIDNDWIYYVDVSNINTKNLFKMSLDGTKVVNLQKGPVCNISLMGEWMTVSFSCGEGEGYETYVMKRDGSCKRLISPNPYSRYK